MIGALAPDDAFEYHRGGVGTEGSDTRSHPQVPTTFVAAELRDGSTCARDGKPAQ